MNRADLDWRYIRRYTSVPIACACIAILALGFAVWIHGSHMQLLGELSANRVAMHRDYDDLVFQRRLVDRYHRRYQLFYDMGFIGRESRLDWVETLRTTTASLDLSRVAYSIEPQLGVIAPVTSVLGGNGVEIRVSKLQLDMGLLHELELLRFFDLLQRQAPGLITVDQCELNDVGTADRRVGDINISASCEARIFSIITSDVATELT